MNSVRSGICLALACLVSGCSFFGQPEHRDEVVFHIGSQGCCWWSREVFESEAKARGTYRATYYDGEGRRFRVDDFIAGEFFFRMAAEYDAAGRFTRFERLRADGKSEVFLYDYHGTGEAHRIEHTRADGVTVVFYFDEDGQPVSD